MIIYNEDFRLYIFGQNPGSRHLMFNSFLGTLNKVRQLDVLD